MTYDDAQAAESAIEWFSGKEFKGNEIKVQLATKRDNWGGGGGGLRRGAPRGGGGAGGGGGGGGFRGGPPGGGRGGDRGTRIHNVCYKFSKLPRLCFIGMTS